MLTGLIPIGDDNEGRIITPYVTYTLIALNLFVFFVLQGAGSNDAFTYGYSAIPYELITGKDVVGGMPPGITHTLGPQPIWMTILTAMFMHGGFMHLFGNLLYLWIFGDNIEDAMGHGKFLMFYLLCGLIATGAHVFSTQMFKGNLYIPSLGASGAIAGVLGGYLFLYPARRVRVLVFAMLGGIIELPALIVIGIWGLLQFLNGFGSIARTQQTEGGGVAYMAHIGGFVAGLILVTLFRNEKVQQRIQQRMGSPVGKAFFGNDYRS